MKPLNRLLVCSALIWIMAFKQSNGAQQRLTLVQDGKANA